MHVDLPAIERTIARFAENEGLIAAYVHGSAAMGNMDEDSDVDIALLAPADLPSEEKRHLRMRAITELMQAFPAIEEKFDVIILQDVPVLLRHNVLRRGRLIIERDRSKRMDFELSVERAYDDEEPYLRRESEMILSRIIHSAP